MLYKKKDKWNFSIKPVTQEVPFLIENLLWTWFMTAKLNCAYLFQPYGNVAESATSRYIDKWSTLFPFGKISIRLRKTKFGNWERWVKILLKKSKTHKRNIILRKIKLNWNKEQLIPFVSANNENFRVKFFCVKPWEIINSPCEPSRWGIISCLCINCTCCFRLSCRHNITISSKTKRKMLTGAPNVYV